MQRPFAQATGQRPFHRARRPENRPELGEHEIAPYHYRRGQHRQVAPYVAFAGYGSRAEAGCEGQGFLNRVVPEQPPPTHVSVRATRRPSQRANSDGGAV